MCIYFYIQMSVIPSVQPFHAIAYPIDPMLALEIRYSTFRSYCKGEILYNMISDSPSFAVVSMLPTAPL